ncbi:crotonobetainyl-CoA:carnitine CoA-transferase CaiB-like acyl-CoA transferase [Bradyrhizobium ottawaense]
MGALDGIRVIAVEQAVAAPFCSSRLADAGAEVIKIERPEGDFARGYDAAAKGQSSYFVWLNRGKQSAVVDLATKEGCAELEKLIASADVLIQNLKPGSMDKLGFSRERAAEGLSEADFLHDHRLWRRRSLRASQGL